MKPFAKLAFKDSVSQHPRAWAHKILDRHKAGDETVSAYALQCALEATGDAPAPRPTTRHFGADDE